MFLSFPTGTGLPQRAGAGAFFIMVLLSLSSGASAAPWRSHLTLPSGDEVLLRTSGRALQSAGSRAEIDLPARVRFARPVDSPGGPVALVDAKVRILCKGGTVTAAAMKPRRADEQLLAAKDRKAAASAIQAPLLKVLSTPAVIDSLCQR